MTLVCVPLSDRTRYSLDETASLTGTHPELLRHYYRLGLFGSASSDREPIFDRKGLAVIRRIANCRRLHGINLAALPLICELWERVDRLQLELSHSRSMS